LPEKWLGYLNSVITIHEKVDICRIFNKLSLQVRSTGHNYGWLTVSDKKILRVHYSHGKGDLPDKIMHKIRGQLKLSEKDFKEKPRNFS